MSEERTGRKYTPKSNKAESARRLTVVIELIAKGAARAEILRYGSEKWGVSEAAVGKYLQRAYAALREEEEEPRKFHRNLAIRRLNYIYKQALAAQDYQRAIAAQRELNLLLGLHEPRKFAIEISAQDEALLKEYNISAADAWGMLMRAIAEGEMR